MTGRLPASTPYQERWRQIEDLFHAARELPPTEREVFLRHAAGDDVALAGEVHSLLDAFAGADESFMAALDLDRVAGLLDEEHTGPRPGDRIGPYVVEHELGRGGMAVVYLARDPRLEREVALKVLSPAYGEHEAKRRLLGEARAASGIDHPNIATVHDVGETADGRPWVAMARYRGRTLRDCIAEGPVAIEEALVIARQIAGGLAAAHAHGIVHCDVKPANVIVTPEGTAKVLDFGIARAMGTAVTQAGATFGTLAYMSPEQTTGEPIDARTDVWAVGVVLYEMLAGRRPFAAQGDAAVIHRIRSDRPPPLGSLRAGVPRRVADIVERCIEKQPERRFGSMAELERALAAAMPGAPLAASKRPWRGNRLVLAVGLATVTLGLAAAMVVRSRLDARGPVRSEAASVLVVPFASLPGDSVLARLGQELAITLARTLDGVDGMSVVDPLTLFARKPEGAAAEEDWARLALEFGATSVLGGSTVRAGDSVRIDVALRSSSATETIARASVTGALTDITTLTDAIAVALLRQIWLRGTAPVPSLAAITTSSVPALRAYLDGERAIAESRFYAAPVAFERAIAADSSFWFAYWRLWYALSWHGQPVDSAVSATVAAHLEDLPEPDRLLVRSRMAGDQRARRALLEHAIAAFPTYWPAWFEYGDWLTHHGPHHNMPLADARRALEHAVALNPDLVPAWIHLFWVAVYDRDPALTDRIMVEFERLRVDSLRAVELRWDVLEYYDVLAALVRSGGQPDPTRADAAARTIAGLRVPLPHESLSTGLHLFGFHTAQLDLLDRIAALRPAPDIAAAHHYGRAWSWAGRGAWDSALVAATRYARDARPADVELLPAQIAILGAVAGALQKEAVVAPLTNAEDRAGAGTAPASIRSELAWLHGVAAFLEEDRAQLAAARTRLAELNSDPAAPTLDRSLAALAAAVGGNDRAAADSLSALERESAHAARQFTVGPDHPFLFAVNRLLAASWLLAAGDTATADALLVFHEAVYPSPLRRMQDGNQAVAPLADLARARIAFAQGRLNAAARLYTHVLQRLDAPAPGLVGIRAEARAALERSASAGS